MWRWLAYTVSGVCLLLAATSAVFWLRSYWWRDSWGYDFAKPYAFTTFASFPGEVCFIRTDEWAPAPTTMGGERRWQWRTEAYSSNHPLRAPKAYPIFPLQFAFGPMHSPFAAKPGFYAASPFWALILLFAAAAAIPVVGPLRRRRRLRRGLCETCGYDLRASPERCPECGTPRPSPHRPSTSGEAPDAT